MKIFSTFTGIGGFEIGIQNAYREAKRRSQENPTADDEARQGLVTTQGQDSSTSDRRTGSSFTDGPDEGPLCVGYSEIDKYASSVYERHYPNVKNYGDITKINAKELPDFDCLVGGFPCQAFSIAGKRGGFDDTRGTLFFDLARILREKQPRYFVFENVKGLVSHDQGNTFRTIITTIDELGYDCQWSVLNSKDFGVPQNRERIIIVGHLRGTPRPEVFPIWGAGKSYSKDLASTTIDANYFKGIDNHGQRTAIGTLRTHKDGNGFREMKSGIAPTIPARAREDGSGQPVVLVPEATKKGYAEAAIGDSINLAQPSSKTRRGRVGKRVANTLTAAAMEQHTLTEDMKIRRLTPLECERLQAFPDNWTAEGTDGVISDTQRYKMCGNAVTTNVIQAVFERIFASER